MAKRRGDPINKLLPLCIDEGDNYKAEWMKLNRRRKDVPPEVESAANRLLLDIRKVVKR